MAATILAGAVHGQQARATEPRNAGFAKLQSFAGDWEGSALYDNKQMPATTSFRLVADGSVIMDDLAPGTPHEMVTMFHMDGKDLLATHYCSHHNQPRLRAVPAQDPNILEFAFKDATNLGSRTDPHMTRVKFTILDPNHQLRNGRRRRMAACYDAFRVPPETVTFQRQTRYPSQETPCAT